MINKIKSRIINKNKIKKKITVAVSGGFDPIHIGHVRLFSEAKKLGNKLIVILNNDNWLKKKKGYVFMNQHERKEVIESIRAVDKVIFTSHKPNPKDMSVCSELKKLKPDVFANGGDRKIGMHAPTESLVCVEIHCREVFGVGRGGKVQSSSWLVEKVKNLSFIFLCIIL
ncbi:MAG: adenylyltransferase/cytidyltransferase family protein [Candidatus Yanofskybacteria bacterium]|nr:adenylyltransferase/cytidyltransferase family protein [Candidatus Yanofskybacteria bacterium]